MILSFVLASFVLNAFAVRALPALDWFSGIWSVVGMVLIMVVLLWSSRGEYQPPRAVFTTFTNETGVSPARERPSYACLLGLPWLLEPVHLSHALTHSGPTTSRSSSACSSPP